MENDNKNTKLKQKVRNYNKRQTLSKKQKRKLARFAQKMRREARRQHELFEAQTDEWIERKRIEEEVKKQSNESGYL